MGGMHGEKPSYCFFLCREWRKEKKWTISTEAASEEVLGRARCIRQLALSAERSAKFLSSQWKASLFIARNVMLKERDTDS